jgi:hypothetical protein
MDTSPVDSSRAALLKQSPSGRRGLDSSTPQPMQAIDFRPWETAPFFGLDGLPVIEALKRNWRELAEEYDRYHRIPDRDEKPYPLGIYQGDWRLGPLRSNETKLSYFPLELQREVIQANSPADTREMDEAAIRRAFIERASQAMERNRAMSFVGQHTGTTVSGRLRRLQL